VSRGHTIPVDSERRASVSEVASGAFLA